MKSITNRPLQSSRGWGCLYKTPLKSAIFSRKHGIYIAICLPENAGLPLTMKNGTLEETHRFWYKIHQF